MNALHLTALLTAALFASAPGPARSTALASDGPDAPWRAGPVQTPGGSPPRLLAALTARRDALLARRDHLTQQLLLARTCTGPRAATTTVHGLDGTPYEVALGPAATVGELWPLLETQHGLVPAHYALHGVPRDGAAKETDVGAPLEQGARVADYGQLVIVNCTCTPLATTFEHCRGEIVCDGPTATGTAGYGWGSASLGSWVPRSGALRARLRLGRGDGVIIGLVREEFWVRGAEPSMDKGWAYYLYMGALYDTGRHLQRTLPAMGRHGGVVEVELRDGALRYIIDGTDQGAVFHIPQEGGRVALAVSISGGNQVRSGCQVTLLDH